MTAEDSVNSDAKAVYAAFQTGGMPAAQIKFGEIVRYRGLTEQWQIDLLKHEVTQLGIQKKAQYVMLRAIERAAWSSEEVVRTRRRNAKPPSPGNS